MAACHLRSISLPSTSHPLVSSVEEQLNKLKASESLSIGYKLSGLKDLYECIDDLLQLPHTQPALSHEKQRQCVEEALDGSIRLLDMCGVMSDFFSQMKESVCQLELCLQRRSGEFGIDAYMASRKKLSKVICKYLRNLKRHKNKYTAADNLELAMLKGAEEISVSLFKSILSFISQPSKPTGWSILFNKLQANRVSCEAKFETNDVEKIDKELLGLKSSKALNAVQVQDIVKALEALQCSLQEAEEELECVYRRLVKTRVSLLNIVNR